MKNWIKFFSIFFVILAVVLTAIITIMAYYPFNKATKEAEKVVQSEQLLSNITSSYVYSSKVSYVTVFGENDKEQQAAVFVNQGDPKAEKQQIVLADGITEAEAIKTATEGLKVKTVLHAKLGIEKPGVVWEVSFKDDKDQLNYVYVLFETGQWWKKVTNL